MDLGLTGQRVWVAAGSRGIGRSCVEAFAAEGARVACCGRTASDLHALAARVGAAAVTADVATAAGVEAFVAQAEAAVGPPDVLVVSAGGPPSLAFAETDDAAWQAAVDLTLLSAVRLCRAVLPGMRARRYGRLVFITSLTVKQPLARMVLSNSLRSAVTALMKTLSLEAGGDGVTANCVAPGYTATERLGHLSASLAAAGGVTPAAIEAGWTAQIPAGRLGEPGEIAAAVVFLASRVAGYVNGQTLVVDGGWSRSLV
jgi:3-oxoacyl-[acyl-carrier protein] reductase